MWKLAKKGYAYNHNYIVDVKISVVKKARRPDNHDSYFFPQGNTLGEFHSVDDARAFIRNFVEQANKEQ